MNTLSLKPVACAIALALLPTLACAQAAAPKADAASPGELAAAQADLQRAARRVAELSRGSAPDARVVIEKHVERRPVVGIVLAPDPAAGVRIAGVTPNGPAAQGGLKSGDRLVSVNGAPILGQEAGQRVENARKLLANLRVKDKVALGYARDGRKAVVNVAPRMDDRLMVWRNKDEVSGAPLALRHGKGGEFEFDFDAGEFDVDRMHGIAPDIRREVIRIGPDGKCKGEACRFEALTEAFRWQGLNLASVDPQLGRYFGADSGVLVLSAGEDLAGLQPGDVIRKVDGKAVSSPREAMAALRARPAGGTVAVDYLRDRKAATAQVKVPKATPFRMPMPPAPPPPPAAPLPPSAPRPPSPPKNAMAPPAPRFVEERRFVVVDDDGNTRRWSQRLDDPDLAPAPPPPMPPVPPVAADAAD